MAFPYKCVLVVGATAGIGKAMADRLIHEGSKVVAVGRRKERLDDFVRQHGPAKAGKVQFDISETEKIPGFAAQIINDNPDLDCVFLNAGVQRQYNFAQPETVDVSQFHWEMKVNYASVVDLTLAFLPFLLHKTSNTSIIFTSSHLGIVPAAPFVSYSASKAAMNSFVMCLREQLRESKVRVIELSPPVVQTELHNIGMGDEQGPKMGMPVEEFTDQAFKGLTSGQDHIVIGSIGLGPSPAAEAFHEVVAKRNFAFERLAEMIRGHF